VTAYCSSDGENWYSVGTVGFPFNEPIYPGLHANGHINRLVYPGAFREGTAIKFLEVMLWETD
jgi:hypothetical protein